MQSYQAAVTKLGGRQSRKLANNTYLQRREDGSIAVKLHATDVVTFRADGTTVLSSGGWKTITTKDRINAFSPVTVTQDKGVWYVMQRYREDQSWQERIARAVVFADGMLYTKRGTFKGVGPKPEAQLKLRSRVRKFAAEYMRKLAAGEIPAPSDGDCWGCALSFAGVGGLGRAERGLGMAVERPPLRLLQRANRAIIALMGRDSQGCSSRQGASARGINTGWCVAWADYVCKRLPGATHKWYDSIGHCAVIYKGRFYDSECHRGVDDWRKLPIARSNPQRVPHRHR